MKKAIGKTKYDIIAEIFGTSEGEAFAFGPGKQIFFGRNAEDILSGGRGKDKLFGGDGDDQLYGGNGRDKLYGGDGADQLFGGNGRDRLFGGDDDDMLSGGNSKDRLVGNDGDDLLYGGAGRDKLLGGAGDDTLEGGTANDLMKGGAGNDLLMSISWGGEPDIAQEVAEGVDKVETDEPLKDNDILKGGKGEDTFTFRWLLDAKEEILDKHRDDDGVVNYRAVAGENGAVHDHWVETIGNDTVTDFDADEDTLVFEGHTVALDSATLVDADGDGAVDDTLLVFYSEQGGAGAHQGDALGTVTVLDTTLTADDIEIDTNVFYGVETPYEIGL